MATVHFENIRPTPDRKGLYVDGGESIWTVISDGQFKIGPAIISAAPIEAPRKLACEYCGCISEKDHGTCEHCGAPLKYVD